MRRVDLFFGAALPRHVGVAANGVFFFEDDEPRSRSTRTSQQDGEITAT